MAVTSMSGYDVNALKDPQIAEEIIQGVVTQSAALTMFTRLPNMTTDMMKMPVLANLPMAYWVDEDKNNGRKQTTKMAWANKYIEPAELAVIVVIKENLLRDANYDVWGQVRPRVIEAFHKKIDQAIFVGIDKPKEFPADLLSAVNQVGAFVDNTGDLYADISNAMGKVEESDYNPTGLIGALSLKKAFRDMLDTNKRPITDSEVNALTRTYINNGAWDKKLALAIIGDFTQAVYSIRQEIEIKLLDQGVITDDSNQITYNLAQEDMVALRFTMRLGWNVPNPINAEQPDESVRFPFAAIKGSTGITEKIVTFTVQDGEETTLEGARVNMGGLIKYTDGSGNAEFKVQAGVFPYVVNYEKAEIFGTVDSATEVSPTVTVNTKKK